jgi:hypothetical protein
MTPSERATGSSLSLAVVIADAAKCITRLYQLTFLQHHLPAILTLWTDLIPLSEVLHWTNLDRIPDLSESRS